MVLEWLPKAKKPDAQTNSEAVVLLHTSLKGLEVGLVLGSAIGSIYSLIRLKKFSLSKIAQSINYGILLGIFGSDAMTFYRLSNSDQAKNQSRAYRLERNPNQNTIDNFTLSGMIVGHFGLSKFPLISKVALMKCYTGGVVGFWLGALYLRMK